MLAPSRPPLVRPALAVLTGLLVAQVLLALAAVRHQGVTADETAHLTAGYAYWTLNDYRLQPENGNLPQRWAALPVWGQKPALDPAAQPDLWAFSDVWRIAHAFFFRSGNSTDYLLWSSRCGMVVWGLALTLLVYGWSRQLWGERAARLSAGLCALSPTVLAHAPLATSDMVATVCLLAAVAGWWSNARQLTLARVLGGGVLTGLAFIAKFSAPLLLPMFLIMGVVRLCGATPVRWRWGRRQGEWTGRLPRAASLAGLTVAHGLITALVIWTAFGWRYTAMNPSAGHPAAFYKASDIKLERDDAIGAAVDFSHRHRLLPEAYLQGFTFVRYHAVSRGAFLAGDYRDDGWWWFFPATFLWKSTEGELLAALGLLSFGAIGLIKRGRQPGRLGARLIPVTPLLAFAAVYGGVSLFSALNIGQRHILPLYAVLFILAGALWTIPPPRRRVATGLGFAALALSGLASVTVFPHYLTYFNAASGGPREGWRKLVDSSLDWGQGLPALAQWLPAHREPDETVYLSYFGSDDYRYQGIDAISLTPIYQNYETRRFTELEPGLYCIGATMLQDVYSPWRGPWTLERERTYRQLLNSARAALADGSLDNRIVDFGLEGTTPLWWLERLRFARLTQYLRVRPPDDIVANSILIYRLSPEEIHTMVDGSLNDVAALLERVAP